jgi:hypothetical protein
MAVPGHPGGFLGSIGRGLDHGEQVGLRAAGVRLLEQAQQIILGHEFSIGR